MKPICVECRRFYRPKKNGTAFIEGMPKFNGAEPGAEHAEDWKPYKLWMGDLWECQGCGHQTISGVGFNPLAEQYQPTFAEDIERHRATLQINDC
jgi:hypothetical protein